MFEVTIVNRSGLLASATAISAFGFLTVAVPAQAGPMIPLAPACTQHQFIGDFALQQSNGARVEFSAMGTAASGKAIATHNGRQTPGHVNGGINGSQLTFNIEWADGPWGVYTGNVDENGFAHGNTFDAANKASKANWDSTVPLGCLTAPADPAPPAAPAPPPEPPASPAAPEGHAATVTSDVDVYDVPGGDGNVIGMLTKGEVVRLGGACSANDWCLVTGKGWAWGEFLQGKVRLPKG